jgi:hypothetical protein
LFRETWREKINRAAGQRGSFYTAFTKNAKNALTDRGDGFAKQQPTNIFHGGQIFVLQRAGADIFRRFPGKIGMIMQRHFEKTSPV